MAPISSVPADLSTNPATAGTSSATPTGSDYTWLLTALGLDPNGQPLPGSTLASLAGQTYTPSFNAQSSSQANAQTSSQANSQTNSQANTQASSQANSQANTQASSQTNSQANTQGAGSSTPGSQTAIFNSITNSGSGSPTRSSSSTTNALAGSSLLTQFGDFDSFKGLSVQAIVLKVLLEAYDSNQQDLLYFANKTQFYNNAKAALRDQTTAARSQLANYAGLPDSAKISFTPGSAIATAFNGSDTTAVYTSASTTSAAPSTKSQLSAYIDGLEQQSQTLSDDSQKANLQLQQITSQAQQLLTQLTQLIKTYNDTSLSIIRNI